MAFSREAGSGGIAVASEVSRRLGWPVYDQELMENLARELKVDVSFLKDYDERRGSFLVDTIKAFSASAGVTEVTYFRRLVQMLNVLGAGRMPGRRAGLDIRTASGDDAARADRGDPGRSNRLHRT